MPGTLAHEGLVRIGRLFAIEAEIRGKPPEERWQQRQLRTKPLLAELREWFELTLAQVSAKSPMAGAIGYAISNWRALIWRDDLDETRATIKMRMSRRGDDAVVD